jgi:hypothetical protein
MKPLTGLDDKPIDRVRALRCKVDGSRELAPFLQIFQRQRVESEGTDPNSGSLTGIVAKPPDNFLIDRLTPVGGLKTQFLGTPSASNNPVKVVQVRSLPVANIPGSPSGANGNDQEADKHLQHGQRLCLVEASVEYEDQKSTQAVPG